MRKMKKIRNSFKYAIEGIWTSFKTERNMKIHIFIMILVIIAGIILKINKSEWIICIILFAIVIGSELFNTSIETIVDMVMPEKNEKGKNSKRCISRSSVSCCHWSCYNRTCNICS